MVSFKSINGVIIITLICWWTKSDNRVFTFLLFFDIAVVHDLQDTNRYWNSMQKFFFLKHWCFYIRVSYEVLFFQGFDGRGKRGTKSILLQLENYCR